MLRLQGVLFAGVQSQFSDLPTLFWFALSETTPQLFLSPAEIPELRRFFAQFPRGGARK